MSTKMAGKNNGLKVLIADDHPAILIGLRNIIERQKPRQIFEAHDGQQALNVILKEKPDLAVLDIYMPNLTGLEILKELSGKKCATKIVMFTASIEKEQLDDALKLGAKGYLLKDNSTEELLSCIDFVMDEGIYISPSVTQKLLQLRRKEDAGREDALLNYLSETEKGILLLLADNLTSKEIAQKLSMSFRTVQNHRANMCDKLNLNGVNSLLVFAIKYKDSLKPGGSEL